MKGRITTIKRVKGFGFIKGEDGTDRFFHANSCVDQTFNALQEGLVVEFEPYEEEGRGPSGGPGARARSVRVVR